MLNLQIPTCVRSIAFLADNEHLSVCCTKEGQLLLYDDQVQRRPVVKFTEKKASYTTVATTHRERYITAFNFQLNLIYNKISDRSWLEPLKDICN